MCIFFYKVEDKYGCFSNFASYAFVIDNVLWKTSEHYFQAHKFDNVDYFNKIKNSKNPMVAAQLGRSRKLPIKNEWETMKDDIMRIAVLEKFQQNPDIKNILLSTGNQGIVENTTTDYYWGCGKDGTGRNMLGVILMETRTKLLEHYM